MVILTVPYYADRLLVQKSAIRSDAADDRS